MVEENPTENFKVTLIGNGISVDRSVPQETARRILDLLLGGAAPAHRVHAAPRSEPNKVEDPNRERPRISLREYIEDVGAQRNPDRILTIGEYMIEHEGAHDFGRDDVKVRFRSAGEPLPANYSRDFTWTIQNGWIAEDPSDAGRFYVTRKGKEAIQQKFSSEVRKASAQKPSTRRRGRRPTGDGPSDAGTPE